MAIIDTSFLMYSDTPANKDPDTYSRTLHEYHRLLWTKQLPSGSQFVLIPSEDAPFYLGYRSLTGDILLSSDSIIHTYTRWKRESIASIIRSIPKHENDEFYDLASTIGGYIVFPAMRINRQPTINSIRGIHPRIMDRFDLTLECIRLWYQGMRSPLFEHIDRYRNFFFLFKNFSTYVSFFLLDDLVEDHSGTIRYWLPFESFENTPPLPDSLDAYLEYKKNISDFVKRRNRRIEAYAKDHLGSDFP